MKQWKILAAFVAVFLAAYVLPLSSPKVTGAIIEAFKLLQWYVRNHTLACVAPALFIAGAITTFLSQAAVMKYLGPRPNKVLAYSVASVAGALFYFATLTEVPITQALMEHGMARGPVVALLLAGPALSLPNMIVLWRLIGARKALTFSALIVLVATIAGVTFGRLA